MPLYTWRCDACQVKVDLLRSFDDSALEPSVKEVPGDESCKEHRWNKIIHPPKMIRGGSWNGSKGNW